MRRLQIAHHLTAAEESAEGGCLARAVEVQLPQHLTVLRRLYGLGRRVQYRTLVGGRDERNLLPALRSLLHALQQVFVELLFRLPALVLAVLFLVHGKLEQLLVVLPAVPAVLLHLFDEAWQLIGIQCLRVVGVELEAFLLRQLHYLRCQLARQLTRLA